MVIVMVMVKVMVKVMKKVDMMMMPMEPVRGEGDEDRAGGVAERCIHDTGATRLEVNAFGLAPCALVHTSLAGRCCCL